MKLGRTTKIRQNFFLSSFSFLFFPNNQNSAEFFLSISFLFYSEQPKFGRIFCAFSSFHHSRYPFSSLHGSTRLSYPYPYRSRLSFLFSPIDYLGSTRPPLSIFVPAHCASST